MENPIFKLVFGFALGAIGLAITIMIASASLPGGRTLDFVLTQSGAIDILVSIPWMTFKIISGYLPALIWYFRLSTGRFSASQQNGMPVHLESICWYFGSQ